MKISVNDLITGFKALGISNGDNIFVTSSLSRFGNVEEGAKGVVDALEVCVGDGTIVMPSFNFSIFKKKPIVLDLANTPSEMGAISEEFRKRPEVKRTHNLFHPLCYRGDSTDRFISCDMVDTWGDKSPYALMEQYNFKVILLGTDFHSCPFFHYAEQKNNVPYREPVEYEGGIKGGGGGIIKCRRLRRKYGDSDSNKMYYVIPNIKTTMIGNSICRSLTVKEIMDCTSQKIQENPNFLLSEDSLLSPMPTMKVFNMMEAIDVMFAEKRDLVSQGFKNSLDYISEFIPLRYHTWKSGDKVETWTIPKGDIDTMYVGEFTVKGYTNKTILLPIHLDHDAMANDNLSGVAVAIELALRLLRTSDLKASYKFLFVPETIGTMAYMSRFNPKALLGIVIDSVGTKDSLVVTKPKFPSMFDKYITGDTNEFLSNAHLWSGNDERVLEAWKIPSIQFSRSPFREYHTKRDTPEIIVEDKLNETLDEVYNFILRIEHDFVPIPTYKGVPCLSNVGLWELDLGIEKIYHLIGYGFSIAQIAKLIDMDFNYVYDFVRKMEKAGLVKR